MLQIILHAVDLAKTRHPFAYTSYFNGRRNRFIWSRKRRGTVAASTNDKIYGRGLCAHHLWFDAEDYRRLGTQIKCNPAIKALSSQRANFSGIARQSHWRLQAWTMHRIRGRKNRKATGKHLRVCLLVQHSLNIMLDFVQQGKISMERVVEKMCHAVADVFQIDVAYIREGYWADLMLVDLDQKTVSKDNILFKCGWSPLEGTTFQSCITHTIVSGHGVC